MTAGLAFEAGRFMCRFTAHIVVTPVAAPLASDPWETHETSLMLVATSSLARPCQNLVWYRFTSRILDAMPADELKVDGLNDQQGKHRRPNAWYKGHNSKE